VAAGADLVDAPVDLDVVSLGIPELDGELAAGAPPSFEVDLHAVLAQPFAGGGRARRGVATSSAK
jgi:hypothetical protein